MREQTTALLIRSVSNLTVQRSVCGPLVRSGAAPYMPDLAVEGQSERRSERFMLDKALLYLANGTRMVWIIYSTRQIVEVLTATERQLLTIEDTLTGGDVLPGFSVAIRDLFPADEAQAEYSTRSKRSITSSIRTAIPSSPIFAPVMCGCGASYRPRSGTTISATANRSSERTPPSTALGREGAQALVLPHGAWRDAPPTAPMPRRQQGQAD